MMRTLGPVAAILLLATAMAAQAPKAGANTQEKADAVLERFLNVSGEREALKDLKTRRDTGTMTLTGLGVSGEVEVLAKAPNKMRMTMKIAGIGEIAEGFDGETAWVQDPIQGYREKSGLELAATTRQADFFMAANYKKHYPKREWLGEAEVNGQPADKIRLHPEEGAPETWYIDKKSSLLVRMDSVSHTAQGDVASQVYLENYQKIDGVMEPMRIRIQNPIAPITMDLKKSETNVDLADSLFQSPKKRGPEEIIIVQ